MNILVACEESQRVCKAFREKGHQAYSCDLVSCSGGHPEWHIKMDAVAALVGGVMRMQTGIYETIEKWDMVIAFPPCTYLTNVATRAHSLKKTPLNWINARTEQRIQAMEFFMRFANAGVEKVAIENPVGIMNTAYRKPDQVIHPWMFAESPEENVTKATCLWLKGLPPLAHDESKVKPEPGQFGYHPSGKARTWEEIINTNRSVVRSKTFYGVAKAMAEQWG